MKRLFFSVFLAFFILGNLISPSFSLAEEIDTDLYFFYSTTCPHCSAEKDFLDKMEDKYDEISFHRYLTTDPDKRSILRSLLEKNDAEKYLGLVPMTFIGNEFFLGFDNEEGIGAQIEEAIKKCINDNCPEKKENENKVSVPFLGQIDPSKYSLPALAIILGFLDGFNVCSLGALVFILGLVLALRSRKLTLIYGGIFIFTTAIIYGLLMFVWYKLFSVLGAYLNLMNVIVGLIALFGGLYFARQFIRFRKHGVACDSSDNKLVNKLTKRIGETLQNKKNLIVILGSILIFAALITIIEFPCSAAVPLVFTGILSQAGLTGLKYALYIAIFVLLYLLDELIVFLIAFFTMKLWLASQKATLWITLIEAIILSGLGIYYLFGWLV